MVQVPTRTAIPGVDGMTPPGANSNVERGVGPALKGGPGEVEGPTVW